MVDQLELSLKDLFLKIMLKWRFIVICMLICGVLFGGLGAYKNSLLNAGPTETEEVDEESLEQQIEFMRFQLTDLETEIVEVSVKEYFSYVDQAESMREYMNESIFMKLDSYNIPTIQKMYQVTVDNSDAQDSNTIARTYLWKMDAPEVYTKIAEELGLESTNCAKELVKFNDVYDGTFSITITAADQEQCEQILNIVDGRVAKMHSGLKKTYGDYEFLELDTKFSYQYSQQVLDQQQKTRNTYLMLEDYKALLDDYFSEDQFAYYNALIALEMDEVVEEEVEEVVPVQVSLINKKYILVGLVLGVLAGCGITAVMYVFSSKLRKTDDLELVHGVPTLATIKKQASKKKVLGGIDKLIYTIFNGKCKTDNVLDDVCFNIKMIAQKNQFNKIYLVSTCKNEDMISFMQNVCEKLSSEFEIRSGELVLEDMLRAEMLIQFEQTGVSKNESIQRVVDLAKIHGIQIGGSVMFEEY